MRLIIEPDYEKMSKWAANYVAKCINEAKPTAEKPFKDLGCPTGSSPLGMYKELIALNKAGKVSFQNVITFNMDEYVNLPEEHPESLPQTSCGTTSSVTSTSKKKMSISSMAMPRT